MTSSRSQVSPHELMEELVGFTTSGIIAGFARDVFPDTNDLRWIIQAKVAAKALYLNTVECRAFVKGVKHGVEAVRGK